MFAFFAPYAFLFLSGVLIGHLLWFRDPAPDKEMIESLEARYAKARESARQRKSEQQSLAKQVTDLESLAERNQGEIIQLQQDRIAKEQQLAGEAKRSESLVDQLQEVLQSRATLEAEAEAQTETLAQMRQAHQQMESEVEILREAQSKQLDPDPETVTVIRKLHEQRETARRMQKETSDRYEDLQRKQSAVVETLGKTKQDLEQRRQDLEISRADRDAVAEELQQTIDRTACLEAELAAAARAMEEHGESHHRLATENESLKKQVSRQESTLAKLRKRFESERDQRGLLLDSLAEKERQVEQQGEQIEGVTRLRSELEEKRVALDKERAELAEGERRLAAHAEELTHREQNVAGSEQTLRTDRTELETMRSALQSHESMQREFSETADRLSEATALCSDLRTRIEESNGKLGEREQVIVSLREEIKKLATQCQHAESERTAGKRKCDELEGVVAGLREQVASQVAAIENLRNQFVVATRLHEASVAENGAVNQELQKRSETLEALTRRLAEMQRSGSDLESLKNRVAELTGHLKRVSVEHEASLDANEQAGRRIRELENELHQSAGTIRQLRRDRGSIDGLPGDRPSQGDRPGQDDRRAA